MTTSDTLAVMFALAVLVAILAFAFYDGPKPRLP